MVALARRMRGDLPAALVPLAPRPDAGRAGRLRPTFVDEGPRWPPCWSGRETADRPGYARRLLTALARTRTGPRASTGLIEPLSPRELDVLRLLGTDLGGPDIARELVVSLNTVRTHTKNIYAKLGVNNRRAAVRRAEELGLLSRTRDRRPGRSSCDGTRDRLARSPHRSPHVVMPAHHIRSYLRGHERRARRRRPASAGPDGTRSASRGTSMPDGPPGSTG